MSFCLSAAARVWLFLGEDDGRKAMLQRTDDAENPLQYLNKLFRIYIIRYVQDIYHIMPSSDHLTPWTF